MAVKTRPSFVGERQGVGGGVVVDVVYAGFFFFLLAGWLSLVNAAGIPLADAFIAGRPLTISGHLSRARATVGGSIGGRLGELIGRWWCLYRRDRAPRPAPPLAAGQTSDGRGLAEELGPAC